jgi:hypothetical protein
MPMPILALMSAPIPIVIEKTEITVEENEFLSQIIKINHEVRYIYCYLKMIEKWIIKTFLINLYIEIIIYWITTISCIFIYITREAVVRLHVVLINFSDKFK